VRWFALSYCSVGGGADPAWRSATAFSTMPAVEEKPVAAFAIRFTNSRPAPAGGLTRGRLFLYKILVPWVCPCCDCVALVAASYNYWSEHIAAALGRAPSFIPVYWHQHTLFCVKHLLSERRAGLKIGILDLAIVDGEIGG